MVVTCDFLCTCILVLVKNRLYVLFVPNGAQWYIDPWSFEFMAKWIHGSLDSWQNGSMAVWIHGTMDAWQFGFMALWMCGRLNAWYLLKHPPRPSAAVQIKTHYVRSPSYTVKAQKLKTPK